MNEYNTLADDPDIVGEAQRRLETEIQKQENVAFMQTLMYYMEHGDMPYEVWKSLPRSTQKHYQRKWRSAPNHIHGRPLAPNEVAVVEKKRVKKLAKNKAARKARASMYRSRRK